MPLSEQEQRLLDEMERGLYHNDADFVAHVGGRRGRPNYRSIVIGVLIAIVGVGALISGVAIQVLALGVGGFILMFAGVMVAISPSRREVTAEDLLDPSSRPSASKPSATRQGFMDRLNQRWDDRQDGQ